MTTLAEQIVVPGGTVVVIPDWLALALALALAVASVALGLWSLWYGRRARQAWRRQATIFADAAESYAQTSDDLGGLLDRIGAPKAAADARGRAEGHRVAAERFRAMATPKGAK